MVAFDSLEIISRSNVGTVIGDVSLTGDEGVLALAKCFQSPGWSNLKKLDLRYSKVGDAGVTALAQAFQLGHLTNLRTLDLAENQVGNVGVTTLAQAFHSGHLDNLQTLDLRGLPVGVSQVGDMGVMALAEVFQSGHLNNLEILDLGWSQMGDAGMAALGQALQSGHLSNLHKLGLGGSQVGDAAVAALAQIFQSRDLSNLEGLSLEGSQVGDTGVVALVQVLQSGHLSNLQTLDLGWTQVGDGGVTALAQAFQSGHLSNLQGLDLNLSQVEDAGLAALAQAFQSSRVSSLQKLCVGASKVGDAGVAALAQSFQSAHLSNLEQLDLGYSKVGDAGVAALAQSFQSGHLSNLRGLYLSSTHMSEQGVAALAEAFRSGHCTNFQRISLSRSKVGDAGVAALAKAFRSGHLSNFHDLYLADSGVGYAGVAALVRAFQSGHLSNLQTLHLDQSEVGDAGVTALAEAFQSGYLSNLRDLLLSRSQVGDIGVAALAKALRSNHFNKLEILDLSGNAAKDEGILEMATTLMSPRHLPSLKDLGLYPLGGAQMISQAAEQALVSAYQKNKLLVAKLLEESAAVEKFRLRNESLTAMLTELQDEPNLPGNHGKVYLCGNPNAGKTTLRKTLVRSTITRVWPTWLTCDRSMKEECTRGIEVSHIVSRKVLSDGRPLMLSVWDLAGQSDYQVLHSAFLPDLAFADGQATFFVIVCSTASTMGSAENDLLFWLRFISSNSVKGVDEELRRQVLVVVNCFEGDRRGHDREDWTKILEECSEKFAKYLNISTNLLILDARSPRQVKSLTLELKRRAKEMLASRPMPQICRHVQDETKKWASENSEYPVLGWQQYSLTLFGGYINEEKLKAATEYLHEAGHLILFKKGALKEGGLHDETLVILGPEWFCQRVVGHLLLPDSMLHPGENTLRRKMAIDGSLRKLMLQNRLEIPREKIEEVVAILLRLGLCYRGDRGTDKIFVPALIESDDASHWLKDTAELAWVMGFSLELKDSMTTVLPIALFRKLQVVMAQDLDIGGRHDCRYASGKSLITFRSKGMAVLVECSADHTGSVQDRLDILVKPLVDDPDDSNSLHSTRQRQVNLAQSIVEKIIGISRDCCPGVELVRKIVRPWISRDGLPPLASRDVLTSAEDVITRIKEHGTQSMNWKVGNALVKEEELLSEGDLRELRFFMEERCDLMIQVVEEFGLFKNPEVSNNFIHEFTDEESQTRDTIIVPRDKQIEELAIVVKELTDMVKDLRDMVRNMRDVVEDVRDGLHLALKQQKLLVRSIQSLERFTLEDKERSVPSFAYLAEAGKPKVWMRFKRALRQDFKLHFMCEAPRSDHTLHEVDGQVGIDIKKPKEWVLKLAPVLDWSLKIAFVAAKIAGTALLPGLGFLIPDLPSGLMTGGLQMTNTIADLVQCFSTDPASLGHDQFVSESLEQGSNREARATTLNTGREIEMRGAARAAIKELLNGLGSHEFKQQVALRRVRISDSDGGTRHVVWICDRCFDEYGIRAKDV